MPEYHMTDPTPPASVPATGVQAPRKSGFFQRCVWLIRLLFLGDIRREQYDAVGMRRRLRHVFDHVDEGRSLSRKELFAALDAPLYGLTHDDLKYAGEVEAALARRPALSARTLSVAVALLLLSLTLWAAFAPLVEVTHAEGTVVGSRRTQSISNLEGGILQELLVNEGDLVEKGQLVARLDNSLAESTWRDARSKLVEHNLAIIRLEASQQGQPPGFPADMPAFLAKILGDAPDEELLERAEQMVRDETATWSAQQARLHADISALEAQHSQRQQEVEDLHTQQAALSSRQKIDEKLLETARQLLARQNFSRMEYLSIEQDYHKTQGDLASLTPRLIKAEAAVEESLRRLESRRAEEALGLSQELARRRAELITVRETLAAGEDRVTRTEVRSPVRGSIKQIYLNTTDGVVKPGEPIMDIVPLDENLLVEARVRPQDVAFLRPGQDVTVKVTAYDFSIYGGLHGKLENISPDTIEDRRGEVYYLVRVRTEDAAIRHKDELLPIIPGMIVMADIIIGEKTVLDYLLKPVLRAKENALTER